MRRFVALAGIALILSAAGLPAAAQTYPPASTAFCAVDKDVVEQGGEVLLTCGTFAPGTDVTVEDNGDPATLAIRGFTNVRPGTLARPMLLLGVPASPAGTIAVRVHFATFATLGTHVLTARGTAPEGFSRTVSASVTVIPGPVTSGGGLPNTGTSTTMPGVVLGLTLVLAGCVAVYSARRWRLAHR